MKKLLIALGLLGIVAAVAYLLTREDAPADPTDADDDDIVDLTEPTPAPDLVEAPAAEG